MAIINLFDAVAYGERVWKYLCHASYTIIQLNDIRSAYLCYTERVCEYIEAQRR